MILSKVSSYRFQIVKQDDILEIKFGVDELTLFKQVEQISDIDMLQAVRNGLKKAPTLEKAREIILAHSQNPDETKPN